MAIAVERTPTAPGPWLAAGRVLLIASGELLLHAIVGFGRPFELSMGRGRQVHR